jgi:hypothetical protein
MPLHLLPLVLAKLSRVLLLQHIYYWRIISEKGSTIVFGLRYGLQKTLKPLYLWPTNQHYNSGGFKENFHAFLKKI